VIEDADFFYVHCFTLTARFCVQGKQEKCSNYKLKVSSIDRTVSINDKITSSAKNALNERSAGNVCDIHLTLDNMFGEYIHLILSNGMKKI